MHRVFSVGGWPDRRVAAQRGALRGAGSRISALAIVTGGSGWLGRRLVAARRVGPADLPALRPATRMQSFDRDRPGLLLHLAPKLLTQSIDDRSQQLPAQHVVVAMSPRQGRSVHEQHVAGAQWVCMVHDPVTVRPYTAVFRCMRHREDVAFPTEHDHFHGGYGRQEDGDLASLGGVLFDQAQGLRAHTQGWLGTGETAGQRWTPPNPKKPRHPTQRSAARMVYPLPKRVPVLHGDEDR